MKKPCSLLLAAVLVFIVPFSASPDSFPHPTAADFSSKSWVAAFDSLHAKFSAEYAFTEWKRIDWKALRARFRPRVVRAQRRTDARAYQLAVREYVFSIPDGHVRVETPGLMDYLNRGIAGSFGFTVAKLEDRSIVASYVLPGGPADRAGMKAGAELLRWNGQTTDEALRKVSPHKRLEGSCLATRQKNELIRLRLLPRAATGSRILIRFRNPSSHNSLRRALRAEDDNLALLSKADFLRSMPWEGDTLEYQRSPGGFPVISIKAELDLENISKGSTDPQLLFYKVRDDFGKLVERAISENAPGLILDIRGNHGGGDELAASIAGFFYKERAFYERQVYYNSERKRFVYLTLTDAQQPVDALYIEPQAPYFDKPVIALISSTTISSGEGVAMGIRKAPKGLVMGFHGTNGSFGMVGDGALLPLGLSVSFPDGRSMDINGRVQLDSRGGVGGVKPDKKIPLTLENVLKFGEGVDVELKAAEECLGDFERCRAGGKQDSFGKS